MEACHQNGGMPPKWRHATKMGASHHPECIKGGRGILPGPLAICRAVVFW